MKILVCDDESITRDLHISLLVENGINPEDIIESSNGKEALRISQENEINLFLIDWNMPDLDGFELVKSIRKIKQYKETPIVMITIEGGSYAITKALEAGVSNYMLKPILPDMFWMKIKPYTEPFLQKK
jgi:two-component system chemotaxis response regulator CheY